MYCILVAGVPASGKTTYAKYIGKKLGIPVISKDEIKEVLFDDIGFDSREEKVTLGVASMNIMYYFAKQCMLAGQPFILENNFEHVSREGLEKVFKNSGYRILNLRIQGDLRVIYQRFVERDRSSDRHIGHVVNTRYPLNSEDDVCPMPVAFETFRKGIKERGMENFSFGETCIEVGAEVFDEKTKEGVLEKIIEWIKNT